MEPNQYILDFPVLHSHSREDFVIGDCNRVAADFINSWPAWRSHALILTGPEASGKTHLAAIWGERTGAGIIHGSALTDAQVPHLSANVVLEGADQTQDFEALLHLYNWQAANKGYLLMTAETPLSAWKVTLADLASRLKSTPVANLKNPDETILAAAMAKQFSDRQILVDEAVISYLIKRMDRSFAEIKIIVQKIDTLALKKKTRVTVPLARKVLERP